MTERSPKSSYNRRNRSDMKTIVAFVQPELSNAVRHKAIDYRATVQICTEQAIQQWNERMDRKDKATIAALREAVEQYQADALAEKQSKRDVKTA